MSKATATDERFLGGRKGVRLTISGNAVRLARLGKANFGRFDLGRLTE